MENTNAQVQVMKDFAGQAAGTVLLVSYAEEISSVQQVADAIAIGVLVPVVGTGDAPAAEVPADVVPPTEVEVPVDAVAPTEVPPTEAPVEAEPPTDQVAPTIEAPVEAPVEAEVPAQAEVPAEEVVTPRSNPLMYGDKEVVRHTTRIVEGKNYHNIQLYTGESLDVTDEEYEAMLEEQAKLA